MPWVRLVDGEISGAYFWVSRRAMERDFPFRTPSVRPMRETAHEIIARWEAAERLEERRRLKIASRASPRPDSPIRGTLR
jgi:hypothetical protein